MFPARVAREQDSTRRGLADSRSFSNNSGRVLFSLREKEVISRSEMSTLLLLANVAATRLRDYWPLSSFAISS